MLAQSARWKQIRISKFEIRKFKAKIFQCSKRKLVNMAFWSFEFGTLDIVSARPGATFSVYIINPVGARVPDLSPVCVFAGSEPGISCFGFRIFYFLPKDRYTVGQGVKTYRLHAFYLCWIFWRKNLRSCRALFFRNAQIWKGGETVGSGCSTSAQRVGTSKPCKAPAIPRRKSAVPVI